jgi:Phosphotransferase enzyme family
LSALGGDVGCAIVIRWCQQGAAAYRGQVLTPPDGLTDAALTAALRRCWDLRISSLTYLAVGWGSHHWEAAGPSGPSGPSGPRWFVTVDDLEHKKFSEDEPLTAAFSRLRASLTAAADLRGCGATFVVAPTATADGEPVTRLSDRFAMAVYPFMDGQSFTWGEFPDWHRWAMLGLVTGVHTAPAAARQHALADDFTVPYRAELEAACEPGAPAAGGPFAPTSSDLVRQNGAAIRRLLARYDGLVTLARSSVSRAVLTHGEPHPGNTMLTAAGTWLLIDWDTALIAPPERDLWSLDPGDGTILAAYTSATGVVPDPYLLDLYRLRWDVTDLALDTRRLRRPHAGSPDDEKTWQLVRQLVERIAGQNR